MAIFYKVATGSEGASYSFAFSPNSTGAGGIADFSGVDTVNPIDKYVTQVNTTSTTQVAPSVSASFATDWVVPFWGLEGTLSTSSIAAGLTSLWQTNTTNNGISAGYKALTNAGATGTFSATTASTVASLGATVALKPATASVGVQYKAVNTVASCASLCTSLAAGIPTGSVAGDFIVASVTWNTAVAVTPPSGWTQINTTQTTGAFSMANYYRFLVAGDATSFTWSFGGTGTALSLINMARFQGVDPAAPIDVTAQSVDASGTSHNSPSVTTTNAQEMLFDIWSFDTGTTATAITSTMTKIWDNQTGNASSNDSTAAGYELLANAGVSGTRNVTSGRATIAMMHTIAIKPLLPTPTLISPASGTTGSSLSPVFKLVSATLSGSAEKYKIQLCSTSNCSSIITTFDQTISQTGWSGQDALTATAYVGGVNESAATIATYTTQTPLTPGTQYYWRGISYDIGISNLSNFSAINSFTTSSIPAAPTLLAPLNTASTVSVKPEFSLYTTDADADNVKYKIEFCSTNTCSTILATYDQTGSQTNWTGQDQDINTSYSTDATVIGSSQKAYYNPATPVLPPGTQYWWRGYAIDPLGTNAWSPASSIFSFTTNTSETRILEGRFLNAKVL